MSKVLAIKNYQILPLAIWLGKQKLHGTESRHRTRFIKLLQERSEEIEKERIGMLEKNQEKTKDDKDTTAKMALEVKSQKRAYLKLLEILKDLADFSELLPGKVEKNEYDVDVP